MSLTPAAIRQRIEAAILAGLGTASGGGWQRSRYPYSVFPASDTGPVAVGAFAVGVTGTVFDPASRQRMSEGALATTVVAVRFTRPIRADLALTDYDAALSAEADLIRVVHAVDGDPDLGVRLREVVSRTVTGDLTVYLGEITMEVRHLYPLAAP